MKIAYILLTNGLEYDDRIRKEMNSMRKLFMDVEFKVFAFHGDNHSESGVLSYGIPYEIVSLKRRGGSKGVISMLRKEYDFYSQIKKKVEEFDSLWVCDHQPFFFPLFSNKPVIWDLHEIPSPIIGTSLKNLFFHVMERRCKWLIHANQERLDYLISKNVIMRPSKNLVLRNYPDDKWIEAGNGINNKPFEAFKNWVGEDEYMYVQGINSINRFAWETLSAIMETHCIKAVIVGNVPEEVKLKIKEVYPDSDSYLYYTGLVYQIDTAAFIAKCKFSIVFYNINTPNNKLCEPNRMFQCLGMGKPVVVGCNEPMKNIIAKYGNGITLNSDGSVVEDNVNAIKQMLVDYDLYHAKAEQSKREFSWEAQNEIIKTLFA